MTDDVTAFLAQCLEMTTLVINLKQKATINIMIGNEIKFEFCNRSDLETNMKKKKPSPSQMQRNLQRKMQFEHRKKVGNIDKKVEPPKLETNSERNDLNADDELKHTNSENGTQTDRVETVTVGTDTENLEENYDKLEDILEADKNGIIKCKENESIIEMKMSHTFNNWDAIETHITGKLGLTLTGKPWIANNGRQFITIVFKTLSKEFEKWKIETFNWQESGLHAVTTSRIYR